MKVKKISQKSKSGQNIVGGSIRTGKIVNITNISESEQLKDKQKRIPLEDNPLHNINLALYGYLFRKFGFKKTGIGFVISGLTSGLYFYQLFFLEWMKNNYLTILFSVLLIYSVWYFQFFFHKSCPECKSKFSLVRTGRYKVDEAKIKGVPHDVIENEYECANCKNIFVEEYTESHED